MRYFFIIIILLFEIELTWGQSTATLTSGTVYSHIVDLREKNDTFLHKKGDNSRCSILAEILYDAIRGGKIVAYMDSTLKNAMDLAQFKYIFASDAMVDSSLTIEKNTGMETLVTFVTDYDYFDISEYKILSIKDKNLNAGNIRIVAIAPVRPIKYYLNFDRDKLTSGKKALYWLQFDDLKLLLSQYEKLSTHNSKINNIVEKYFMPSLFH